MAREPAKARRGLKTTARRNPPNATGREYFKEARGKKGKVLLREIMRRKVKRTILRHKKITVARRRRLFGDWRGRGWSFIT